MLYVVDIVDTCRHISLNVHLAMVARRLYVCRVRTAGLSSVRPSVSPIFFITLMQLQRRYRSSSVTADSCTG